MCAVHISKNRDRTKELELRRSDSSLAPVEQPNPTAKRKEKDMTGRKVEARKQCNKCDEWKDESQYYKCRKHYDGLADVCKACADKATNKCRRRRKAMAEEAELAKALS